MAKSDKLILLAGTLVTGALVVAAGGAYAADPQQQQVPQTNQLSYAAPETPAPTVHRWEHYEVPPGYYQNPWMVPYSRHGYGPKPN